MASQQSDIEYKLMDEHDDPSMATTEKNASFEEKTGDEESIIPRKFELPHNYTNREKARLVVVGIKWQFMILVCCILDVILLIYQSVNTEEMSDGVPAWIQVLTWGFLLAYVVDISVRLYVYHLYLFFKNPFNVFDFVVVLVSVILQIVEEVGKKPAGRAATVPLIGLRAAYRAALGMRVVRSFFVIRRMGPGASQAARNLSGENKKRYVDLENSYDIDLTYINNEVIAMGVPATGFIQIYRNPIKEVVRFFNQFHKGQYRIYNLCPEHPYPAEKFDNNVCAFDVQDHTPPTMDIMIEFLQDAEEFLKKGDKNVLAVHCRGGKGRTGSIVCAWLMYSQYCERATAALEFFAHARTELRKNSKKLQGVDTPSQKRYVMQLDRYLKQLGASQGSGVELVKVNADVIRLNSVDIDGFFSEPEEETGPLVAAVHQNGAGGGSIIHVSAPVDTSAIQTNKFKFNFEGFECSGDIRITIFKKKKLEEAVAEGLVLADAPGLKGPTELTKRKIAGKEPGVVFYFVFHTAFLDNDEGELRVPMPMMDKAFKNKKQRYLASGIAMLHTSKKNSSA